MSIKPAVQSAPVTPADFPPVRWHGHWIWCEPPPPARPFAGHGPADPRLPEAHGLFRKTFSLDEAPDRAPARITADSRYLLYCNGREVYRGPVRSQPRRTYYDLFDLAPYLQPGENTLAVYVKFYGSAKSFWMPAPPSASLGQRGVLVFEALLGADWLVSDESWKAHKSSAWSEDWRNGAHLNFMEEGIPLEAFDARQFPAGWEQPGFDDSAWPNASRLLVTGIGALPSSQPPSDPYGPLYPRPIAKLAGALLSPVAAQVETLCGRVEDSVGDPVRRLQASLHLERLGAAKPAALPLEVKIQPGDSLRIQLDMGRIVMGQVQFALEAPAGAVIDFSLTEDPLGPPRGPFGPHSGCRYTARGADDDFRLFDALGFRYANLLVQGPPGQLTLRSFAVQEDLYPWQPGAEFRCSDEDLNRIYQACIRTVQLNARDAFTDCPTREQQAWVGDSVVHQMVTLLTSTDWRLAWHYLTLSDSPRSDGILPMTVVGPPEAHGSRTIPDWSLHWVHGVYNLYRFAGDRAQVLRFMPSVARVLRWFAPFQNQRGVLENVIEWALIDWSAVSVDGESAIYTAIWARGLREYAEMAGWLGEQASQAWAEGLYARAQAGFEAFWDESRGVYADHIVDGELRPEVSQLAGALGIVSGLAPAERWQRIINWITAEERLVIRSWVHTEQPGPPNPAAPRRFSWDVQQQVVMAEPFMSYVVHDAVAAAGLAEQLPGLCRRWSQFLTGGYDTIGEDWNRGTHAHGWSCTPTKDLVLYTLGVTPAEPGFTAVRVAPRLGELAWAEGKIPTPHGLVAVRAEAGCVTVDSPVPVIIELPGQPARRLPAGQHTHMG